MAQQKKRGNRAGGSTVERGDFETATEILPGAPTEGATRYPATTVFEQRGSLPVKAPTLKVGRSDKILNARPDTIDFRDRMFEPTLVEVPSEWPLELYLKSWPRNNPCPILNQGQEGACTGFGLAAVVHYLLYRRKVVPDRNAVSPRMLYEMARRYDEWSGENYSGSSARGAMKGWHKHGVCADSLWPYKSEDTLGTLTPDRARDALRRPLGAYFRVNHRDLVYMHTALAEVGILYATARVHEGWSDVRNDGIIHESETIIGGHAFAIVGYDSKGFWLQNSWGDDWGRRGFAHVSYDDWLTNGSDVWVARAGAPIVTSEKRTGGQLSASAALSSESRRAELQHHTVAIGNDGALRSGGEVGNTHADVKRIFEKGGDFDRVTARWKKPRLLIYAHGGLVGEPDALQRVSEYLEPLLENEVYPLAFIWRTNFSATLGNILEDAFSQRQTESWQDKTKDFMLDRIDDTLEPVARGPGKMVWDEMKENAILSTSRSDGGARFVLTHLQELLARKDVEVHFAGHSAGSIFLGPFVQQFCEQGGGIGSLTLWAPACTMEFFKSCYLPVLENKKVDRFSLFTLKDPAERDDYCAKIYNKSLLYLVAHAFERKARIFFGDGTPLLGMEKFILQEPTLFGVDPAKIRRENPASHPLAFGTDSIWYRSPNNREPGEPAASNARRHGEFDDDDATVQTTLARIIGHQSDVMVRARPTAGQLRNLREQFTGITGSPA